MNGVNQEKEGKSWEPFGIYLLNSMANPTQIQFDLLPELGTGVRGKSSHLGHPVSASLIHVQTFEINCVDSSNSQ
jgi:hypothetical protein